MAFTTSDLEALEAAIKSGILKVKYSDKEITYASMSDLIAARNLVLSEVNGTTTNNRRTLASYCRD